ncbi:hypothetical protein B7760_00759 [Burkholderia glumae]|nr:hypothetical protein B7760_00759 [Burkholderia glumae]
MTTGNPGNGGAGLEGLAHDGELLVDGTPATLLGLGQNLDGFDVVTGLKHRRKTTSSFKRYLVSGFRGGQPTHDYQLYLALNDIEHTKTKARHPQTTGICERFHKTILQEFYQVAFRHKLYLTLAELQVDLETWLMYYNGERTHQGKMCCGRTPLQTLIAGKEVWKEKVSHLNLI